MLEYLVVSKHSKMSAFCYVMHGKNAYAVLSRL